MKNSFIKAQLTSLKTIQLMVFTNVPRPYDLSFTLFKGEKDEGKKLKVLKQSGSALVNIFELELPEQYEFGKQYYVQATSFSPQQIDVNNAIYFPEFDELFNYHNDDLGATYYKDHTDFAVWAPLATKVDATPIIVVAGIKIFTVLFVRIIDLCRQLYTLFPAQKFFQHSQSRSRNNFLDAFLH